MRLIIALLLLIAPVGATAKPLVIATGDTVAFRIQRGEPVNVRLVDRSARPRKGEVVVGVRALLGTAMSAVNGTGQAYRFTAELLRGGKASPARSCTLPSSTAPILETWPGKPADAVRISRFVPVADGSC